jgi:hypothetical protein
MTCRDLALEKLLAKASKAWGLRIELSPVAAEFKAALDVDMDGAPTLKQFLDWLASSQGLTCGRAGDRLVLVPACSLRLKRALDEARREKQWLRDAGGAGKAGPAKAPAEGRQPRGAKRGGEAADGSRG